MLRELLNRIKWDPDFGKGTFALGDVVRIPFHRVRTVYKDGAPIWYRLLRAGARG